MRLLFLAVPALRTSLPRAFMWASRSGLHTTRAQFDDSGFVVGFGADTGGGAVRGASSVARPPSDKQVEYAQRLSMRTEKPIPPAALEDSMEMSAYIESALSLVPPTEKQVAFAMQLAEVTGETVPESAMDSSATISEYINAKRGKQDGGMGGGQGGFSDSLDAKPSTKQLNFALFLALQNKVGLSYEAIASKRGCSAFIEQLKARGPGTAALTGGQPYAPQAAYARPASPFEDADIPF